jgi:hypothetical protein
MNIYFFLMLFTFFLILFSYKKSIGKQNKCLLAICVLWSLVWGLRGYGVGNDTPEYAKYFNGTGIPFWGYGTVDCPGDTIEPGFIIIGKFLSLFSDSPTFFFLSVAILQFSAIYYLYKDRCASLWGLLFFFIVGLGYEAAIIATRQSLSLSLVLWAVCLLEKADISKLNFSLLRKNRKVLLAVFLFVLALYTHRTSLLIFPVLVLLYFWRPTKKHAYIIISSVFLITLLIPNSVKIVFDAALSQISLISDDNINLLGNRYKGSFESDITIIKIILWAIPVFTCLHYTKREKVNTFAFKCYMVSVILNMLLTGTTMIERLSITFTLLGFRVFVPVEVVKNKKVALIFIVSSLLFLARTYQGFVFWDSRVDSMVPYYFFWEK